MKAAFVFCALGAASAAFSLAPNEVRQLEWDMLLPAQEREHFNPAPPAPLHDYLGEGGVAALQTGSLDGSRTAWPSTQTRYQMRFAPR